MPEAQEPSVAEPSTTTTTSRPASPSDDTIKKKKRKKDKSKKHSRKEKSSRKAESPSTHQFDGTEDFYVDKQPSRSYANVDTLHRPACPRYKVRLQHLGDIRRRKATPYKRYFEKDKHNRITSGDKTTLTDEEFTAQTKQFKERIAQSPRDIDIWLEYVQHQHQFPMTSTRAQLCERKLDVLRQGLLANPGNAQLYCEYVRILDETYPSYEVSKILDSLITKGEHNSESGKMICDDDGFCCLQIQPITFYGMHRYWLRKARWLDAMCRMFSNSIPNASKTCTNAIDLMKLC